MTYTTYLINQQGCHQQFARLDSRQGKMLEGQGPFILTPIPCAVPHQTSDSDITPWAKLWIPTC